VAAEKWWRAVEKKREGEGRWRERERGEEERERERGGEEAVLRSNKLFFSLLFLFQCFPAAPPIANCLFCLLQTTRNSRKTSTSASGAGEEKEGSGRERERSFRASMKASLLGATESRQKAERRSSIGFFVVSCFVALSLRDEGLVSSSPSPRQISPGFRAPVSFSTICDR